MDKSEFLNSFREVLERDSGPLTGREALDNLGWDSLALVQFLALADEKYGVPLIPAQVQSCRTVDDVYCLVVNGRS